MLETALARHLDSLDIVTFDETGTTGDCFIAAMPSGPDSAVCLMPTGGLSQPTRRPTDVRTVQALVRGPKHDPRPPLAKAQAIYDALACLDGVTLDDGGPDEVHVIGCTPAQSGPIPMGHDELARHEFSLNFEFRIHAPTAHRPALA